MEITLPIGYMLYSLANHYKEQFRGWYERSLVCDEDNGFVRDDLWYFLRTCFVKGVSKQDLMGGEITGCSENMISKNYRWLEGVRVDNVCVVPELAQVCETQREVDLLKSKFDEGFEKAKCCKGTLKCIFPKKYYQYTDFHNCVSELEGQTERDLTMALGSSGFGFLQTNDLTGGKFLKD